MAKIEKICFEIETITPMFLSGADQSKAELRAASIKGLLRFWWRALQAESNIDELREKESQIFGSSDEEKGGGSSFSLRITRDGDLQPVTKSFPNKDNIHKITVTSKTRNKTFPINILEYLAYGPFDPKAKKVRPYFDTTIKFNVIFLFRNDHFVNDVLKAMYVFFLFGGIGSRSRNGFGGFLVINNKDVFAPISSEFSVSEPYSAANLQNLVKQVSTNSYSSFSRETNIFKTKNSHNTWDESLADVGKTYRGIRVGDKKVNEAVFEPKHQFNKRQYLGAPLEPYQERFKSFLDRHAKPYFIKVAKEGTKYRSYILYLPSQYCAGQDEDRNGRQINHSTSNSEFLKICNEFNGFLDQHMETIL